MALEISGVLIQKLPQETGQGKNGPWVKQNFIIETQEQINRKICVSAWGDRVDAIQQFAIGTFLKIAINIESREFNGRWYTDVKAWKIEPAGTLQPEAPMQMPMPMPMPDPPVYTTMPDTPPPPTIDDLPF